MKSSVELETTGEYARDYYTLENSTKKRRKGSRLHYYVILLSAMYLLIRKAYRGGCHLPFDAMTRALGRVKIHALVILILSQDTVKLFNVLWITFFELVIRVLMKFLSRLSRNTFIFSNMHIYTSDITNFLVEFISI